MGYDGGDKRAPFYPISVSKSTNLVHAVVNVLFLGNENISHFVLIKSLDALLRKPSTKASLCHVRLFCNFDDSFRYTSSVTRQATKTFDETSYK